MAKRLKETQRFRVSDAIYQSCLAYSKKDLDLAFRWAVKVAERAKGLYLNPHEHHYISTVLKRMDGKFKN